MTNAGLDEAQVGVNITRRNINNLTYADDTTFMAESEEELKSLLIKVKEESEKGLNVQRRFPMAARDGKFSNFEPISRSLLKEAKRLLHQYDADVKLLTVKTEAKSLYDTYIHKLIKLLPYTENSQVLAQQVEKKIVTNEWLDCTEDNYWVEEELEQNDMYFTLVCFTIESYDDKKDQTIAEQFIYMYNNCPYSWNILVNSGAKYMVVEKPKIP